MPIKTNIENPLWTYIFLNAKFSEDGMRSNPKDFVSGKTKGHLTLFLLFYKTLGKLHTIYRIYSCPSYHVELYSNSHPTCPLKRTKASI